MPVHRRTALALSGLLVVSAPAGATAALVGYYDFESPSGTTILDRSGNARNATLAGNAVVVTTGIPAGTASNPFTSSTPDSVLSLDGVDDYVETSRNASVFNIDGNKPKAVSAWVYAETFNNGGIFEVGTRSNNQGFSLRTLSPNNNAWRAQFTGTSADYDFTTTALTPSVTSHNAWVHFVQTWDGTTSRTYLNGNLAGSRANALNTSNTLTFRIGQYNTTEFDGYIDDVAIYDQNLTQANAQALFSGADPASVPEPTSGLAVLSAAAAFAFRRARR